MEKKKQLKVRIIPVSSAELELTPISSVTSTVAAMQTSIAFRL
jgi:hypothetical protein